MNVKILTLFCIFTFMVSAPAFAMTADADADGSFTVTDGTGETFEYDGPTERIVTMGYASTLTVAMLGEIDKIIAVDAYSTYDYTKDERLKDLLAKDMGSIYNDSNNAYIKSQFVQWVQAGLMSLNDTIILTAYSNAKVLRDVLKEHGFEKVLVYLSVTDYDAIVDFVKSMSLITTGRVSTIVNDMILVKDTIDDRLTGIEKTAKGLGVWYTASGTFAVGNTGSIFVSLIDAAGGTNIARNADSSSSTYGSKSIITQLMEEHPDAVIFLPNSYMQNHTISDFRKDVLGGDQNIKVVQTLPSWNNYCPDAADGLWAFACAFYPDIFEGEAPHTDEPSDSNILLYVAAGIAVVAVTAVAAFILMRNK